MAAPTPDETRAFFDAIAPQYDRVYGVSGAETRRKLAAVMARFPRAPADVLDLGIGTGRELPALLDAGHRVTGVDVAIRMLAEHDRRSRRAKIVTGDFYARLPFAERTFDVALALFGALAHPPDGGAHARLADELARVLRSGGLFFAEVPSPGWLARLPSAPPSGDRAAWRVGEREARHEDRALGASITIVVPSAEEWRASMSVLDPTIEEAGDELWIVGRAR